MIRIAIIDFYVDEPTCLGVPPFFSVYPRYLAGALRESGIPEKGIKYISIDDLRLAKFRLIEEFECIFITGGATVPGKYLATKIGTSTELLNFLETNFGNRQIHSPAFKKTKIFLGGSFTLLPDRIKSVMQNFSQVNIISGDLEKFASIYIQKNRQMEGPGDIYSGHKSMAEEISRWAILGAFISGQSSFSPYLVHEIETYRGCPRNIHCSFCSEKLQGAVRFREADDIAAEIRELTQLGQCYFRLGKQADILAYKSKMQVFKKSFPKPEPEELRRLYEKISSIQGIKLLHLDNVNPGTIFNFPAESKEILSMITHYNSPGDTAALGIESVDPEVISANNLKLNHKEALSVIRIINDIGGYRKNGIPALLPGINLIHGLIGETQKTFELNYGFLKEVLDNGLMLRRINIRQAVTLPGTMLARKIPKQNSKIFNRFLFYKEKIREEIDHPMLGKIFPVGTRIPDVLIERNEGEISLGRQLASYPITCKFHKRHSLHKTVDAIVIGHQERSINAIAQEINVNQAESGEIQRFPGIGKSKKMAWIMNRPFATLKDFYNTVQPGMEFEPLKKYLKL